jgi:hypothetical protein
LARFQNQLLRIQRGPGVIPQQCRADHVSGFIQADHPVLLATHRDGIDVVQAARLVDGLLKGRPPMIWMDFGTFRVWGAALAHQGASVRVPDDYLAGLGGAVDPCYERHALIPLRTVPFGGRRRDWQSGKRGTLPGPGDGIAMGWFFLRGDAL